MAYANAKNTKQKGWYRMKLTAQIFALLALNKSFEKLFTASHGATSTSLSFGQIVSMRKKNNRGKIVKRLKGTLGKSYHRN